jgi:hypothetical protein
VQGPAAACSRSRAPPGSGDAPLEGVDPGHDRVDERDVRIARGELRERLLAIERGDHLGRWRGELSLQPLEGPARVVDNERTVIGESFR